MGINTFLGSFFFLGAVTGVWSASLAGGAFAASFGVSLGSCFGACCCGGGFGGSLTTLAGLGGAGGGGGGAIFSGTLSGTFFALPIAFISSFSMSSAPE